MNKLAIFMLLTCAACYQSYGDDSTIQDEINTSLMEVEVNGIGSIKVGEGIVHKEYGRGQIKSIDSMQYDAKHIVVAFIEFDDVVRTMLISSEHFESTK